MPADASLESLDFLASYGAHVAKRLMRNDVLAVEQPTSIRVPAVFRWFEAHLKETIRRFDLLELHTMPRELVASSSVRRGLENCQKPFQLWNVEREVWNDGVAFEHGLKYALGHIVVDFGPNHEGHPGTVEPVSKIAAAERKTWVETHQEAWRARRDMFAMLARDEVASLGLAGTGTEAKREGSPETEGGDSFEENRKTWADRSGTI